MKNRNIHFITLAALLFMATACGSHDVRKSLIRNWKVKDNAIDIEFKNDNTYQQSTGSETDHGHWHLDGSEKILTIIHENGSDSEKFVIRSITPDTLTLKTKKGVTVLVSGK